MGPADDMSLKNIQISGKISLQNSFDTNAVFVSALCTNSSYPNEMTNIQNSTSINIELNNCEVDTLEVSAFGRIDPNRSKYSYSNLKNTGDITILADESSDISRFWISGVLRNGHGKRISLDGSSNEGKISVTNNGSKYAYIYISGISNDIYTLNKGYNSGLIIFKGKAGICKMSGLSVGSDNKITQCYNKGLIKASVTNRCKNTVELAGLNYEIKPAGNISNSYNAGNIYYSGNAKNKVKIAGITANLEEDSNIKFCYNSGTLKGSAKCEKASISDSFTASKVFGNYFVAGKAVINGKSKNTQAKKVAAINKKNCPKLSADYWVYSSAKKRMVLKNNKEG